MQPQIDHYASKLAYEIDAWDLAQAQKNDDDVVVLDARTAPAYCREHIAAAISFPHQQMTAEHTAGLRRDVLYVVYCDGIGCNASTAGALKMAQLGFRVKELIGGLEWWKRSGFPTQGALDSAALEAESCGCN
ncbi:rhodanese-like domain-containing protein [Pseudomonas sp. LPB0260]|uniref:rhodanese-like domain-containing protein n=1 Tax=Pseudomonas sp. LPB0260 TaxID=2614442 RepID=UPI0015C21EB8|nr:rhodanese-like domain-containing protein [Pseudomonas sp. LPB0260]QLC72651.1 rhodanese-like domain-containing protein [Pseudomonas sp. LPB0260]QLC75425.1 rhodanese-like domain-containing protein [Pseudomonas sp. LPB0260]